MVVRLIQWYGGTMDQWYGGAVVRWNDGTVVPRTFKCS